MINFLKVAFLVLTSSILGQDYPHSGKISDCDGAVSLAKGAFSLNIPNSKGTFQDLDLYEKSFPHNNSIWLKFIAKKDGKLNLTFNNFPHTAEIVVFKEEKERVCDKISLKKTQPIKQVIAFKNGNNQGFLNDDFLEMRQGQVIFFSVNFEKEKIKESLKGDLTFVSSSDEDDGVAEKIIDLTQKEDKLPVFEINLLDKNTKKPVMSSIVINKSRGYDAYYQGSGLKINIDRSLRFELKIDAVGYFPMDTSFKIVSDEDKSIEINLLPVEIGTQITLQGIEFLPESTQLTGEAVGKLKRLRDFLALNASVNIEVQGHVHKMGRNTIGARLLSRRRARSVARELIKSGIDKSRISFRGFGNSEMKYPEAESSAEESANRRVEIKITQE